MSICLPPPLKESGHGRRDIIVDTKALKKQLGAAIAMVLVAAVALGSSTYAWFVSNNTVKATSNNVAAKSNSAYLVIANSNKPKTDSDSTASAESVNSATALLYPAIWANTFNSAGNKASDSDGIYQFESAYASSKESSNEKDDTRFIVGNASAAVDGGYATLSTFHIGTGGYDGIFKDLKVTGFEASGTDSGLLSAMRVYVTDGENWVVVRSGTNKEGTSRSIIESQNLPETSGSGVFHTASFGKSVTKDDVKGTDVDVFCYVYYDGSDGNVYTTNLGSLAKECKVILTFEATPTTYPGKTI